MVWAQLIPVTGQLNESDPILDDFVESSLDLELMMGLLDSKQEVLLYETGTVNKDPFSGTVIFQNCSDCLAI